jgi:hypothetical protein
MHDDICYRCPTRVPYSLTTRIRLHTEKLPLDAEQNSTRHASNSSQEPESSCPLVRPALLQPAVVYPQPCGRDVAGYVQTTRRRRLHRSRP